MANFDKITKGITKPCAKIQSIVSSTSGYKEEGDEENNEIKGRKKEENNEEKENNKNENNEENEEEQDNN